MFFILINWTSLLVYLALGILGLWISYTFMKKSGVMLFSVFAIILSLSLAPAQVYDAVSVGIVLMPLVFLALLLCQEKFGKTEAQRLFYISLATMGVMFVFNFFQAAYIDAAWNMQILLDWSYLGVSISQAVAYAGAVCGAYYITQKVAFNNLNETFHRATKVSIASVIYTFVFVFLGNIGQMLFGRILLLCLITLVIAIFVSVLVAYLARFIDYDFAKKIVAKKPVKENRSENKEEVEVEEKENLEKEQNDEKE